MYALQGILLCYVSVLLCKHTNNQVIFRQNKTSVKAKHIKYLRFILICRIIKSIAFCCNHNDEYN